MRIYGILGPNHILSRRDLIDSLKIQNILSKILVKKVSFFDPKNSKMVKNSQKMTKNDEKIKNLEKKFWKNSFLVGIDSK